MAPSVAAPSGMALSGLASASSDEEPDKKNNQTMYQNEVIVEGFEPLEL